MSSGEFLRVRRRIAAYIKAAVGERSLNDAAINQGIPTKTLHNVVVKIEFDLRLSTIVDVANAFGLEAWELLYPRDARIKRAAMELAAFYERADPDQLIVLNAAILGAEALAAQKAQEQEADHTTHEKGNNRARRNTDPARRSGDRR